VVLLGTAGPLASAVENGDSGAAGLTPVIKPVPHQNIEYEGKLSPDWKASWDLARSLYRDEKYAEALVQYEILFSQKDNIEEARWEYASILLYLERWENAKAVLEKLLATEPESVRYLIAMARVNMATGDVDKAVAIYSRLREEPIQEKDLVMVLEGLVKAYETQEGKVGETAVLLEQLAFLTPEDNDLQIRLASVQLDLGNIVRAEEIGRKLKKEMPENIAVISLLAKVAEMSNREADAAELWRQVVGHDQDSAEANGWLYNYYLRKGNWAESFRHLEPLIRKTPNDVNLLLRAADLNMRMDRIDRALEYYEYCLALQPLNRSIAEDKKTAQRMMAEDLLVLVESENGSKLWQDIDRIIPDSVGVLHEIADLLRDQGKIDKLIEVLFVLNRKQPHNTNVYEELVSLLEQQGYVDELNALRSGNTVPPGTGDK